MSVEATIEQFIIEQVMIGSEQTAIARDESLLSGGILDSLALLRLISFLEDKYGVNIEDGDVIPENFESIAAIDAFLDSKRQRDED